MAKQKILGIDFSRDYSQLSYLDDTGKPKSVSIGTESNYLIPTAVCFNSELKEWSAGRRCRENNDGFLCIFIETCS